VKEFRKRLAKPAKSCQRRNVVSFDPGTIAIISGRVVQIDEIGVTQSDYTIEEDLNPGASSARNARAV
jgi:hypothetical protein